MGQAVVEQRYNCCHYITAFEAANRSNDDDGYRPRCARTEAHSFGQDIEIGRRLSRVYLKEVLV
jgi:hypothetical protein